MLKIFLSIYPFFLGCAHQPFPQMLLILVSKVSTTAVAKLPSYFGIIVS